MASVDGRRAWARADGPHVFVRRSRAVPARLEALKRAVLRTLATAAPHVRGDVSLVLTSDAVIRSLNRRYRNRDVPTDVLAFELGEGANPGEPFGDVVVSLDSARRQARAYGATLHEELLRLIIHGTLHLCGYDHHERRHAARMHALTRRLLKEASGG
ncbi:MAG: rRNA maturation RNase YbeY [Candidatus Eremiobacteraeota bacterium]|nr:rRNA maturation RNase YbeY [Candidatus Eremiobacteraeota bacterium]MBV8222321.1 rRNA maturation RNase YbeY [Candidatus Eremiobacteraeota bacterium]